MVHKLFQVYGWGGLSEPDLKQIVRLHSHVAEMSLSIGFNLFQLQHATFQMNELLPPTNEHLPFGLKRRKGGRPQGMATLK